jgi:hypothetical protein
MTKQDKESLTYTIAIVGMSVLLCLSGWLMGNT